MEDFIKAYLKKRGYEINNHAMSNIKLCNDWYSNRAIIGFHNRKTVQGKQYELNRLNFAKRCCSDDANLFEILEINAGNGEQAKFVNDTLQKSEFNTQYRKQLEQISANGTVACYVRLDNATILDNGTANGGDIKLNYVEADSFIPLTVENDIVLEVAFAGSTLKSRKKQTTLVLFVKNESGLYSAETHVFDEQGKEIKEAETKIILDYVKPFAVMRNAEVNNLDGMIGYGLPKLYNAIPLLKMIDLAYNVLYSDLDKAEKIILVNEILCDFENGLIQEYNPEIRIEQITKTFELSLSLLSMMFGYGTKKYFFEGGQITTETEYIGERKSKMQEINRQRQEGIRYIRDICKAILWFSNKFHDTSYNLDQEILVNFDNSYITNKEVELERKRNDALTFSIPQLTVWYLMDAYSLTEEKAIALVMEQQKNHGNEVFANANLDIERDFKT